MKFIVVDPCYVMDEKQYQKICPDFEGQDFPLKSKHKKDGDAITFHKIEGTPNGDGSGDHDGYSIGVDAGMLSIVERAEGWDGKKEMGCPFLSLAAAEAAFDEILEQF